LQTNKQAIPSDGGVPGRREEGKGGTKRGWIGCLKREAVIELMYDCITERSNPQGHQQHRITNNIAAATKGKDKTLE